MLIAYTGLLRHWAQSCLEWLRLDEVRCAACHKPYRLLRQHAMPALPPLPHQSNPLVCPLCPTCSALLRIRTAGFCARCGLPMAFGDPAHEGALNTDQARPSTGWCEDCLRSSPPWTRFYMVNAYTGPLRHMIIRAKFHGDAAALRVLGILLAQAYERGNTVSNHMEKLNIMSMTHMTNADNAKHETAINGIVPVPLHPERLRERGYNQCLELVRPLAYRLNVPVWSHAVSRTRDTASQRGLSRKARLGNLAAAFWADDRVVDQHLLVVDDIMTTGSTARHVVEALLRGGARVVDLAVVARVPGTFNLRL